MNFCAFDINTVANEVYSHNFGFDSVNERNIASLTAEEMDAMAIDLLTMSPPCQPFTRLGLKLDTHDRRTDSFIHVMTEVIPSMKHKPKHILIENVKGFEESKTRDLALSVLKNSCYEIREFLLSPTNIGIPNSRLRYYLLAKQKNDLNSSQFVFPQADLFLTEIPATEFNINASSKGCRHILNEFKQLNIASFVDHKNLHINEANYLLPDNVLRKYSMILDIVDYESVRSCCFTRGYGQFVHGTGSVLKTNSVVTIDEVYSKIDKFSEDEDQEKGNRRIQLLKELKLRYFTPREVANLMCFPQKFSFPTILTDRQMYKLLGNSVNVKVISLLLRLLLLNAD
ncbi:tRNA (cytosine(38)-C(5))-methyltransferase-like isoform X4 [Dinothrombium tinctorium]|uniref:tRNA (cytosine(38)-C(5))-methyltransferase n=1 Tax=Dinothrombium tinctorium TaxID=1965070 RepID=A0A443RM98_9ACAR|nr:tRNA (cytosine(38)-C(5))-methyltransferase-like isoform X4 [Dinothrombium tinctorium]